MAPSRRRGGGKAAAAAPRREWKVGDLVLAKLKGYPSWPATVSEPEKWGFQPDWKKVLVYFFGTQQIAFCNPADVEEFTEETKQSLLTKRQGKGADFVRAVQEIIESYEKSKNQDHFNPNDKMSHANGGKSEKLSSQFEVKDQRESSKTTATCRNGTSLLTSNDTDVAESSSLHEKESLFQQATNSVTAAGKPVLTTYISRKRSGGLRSRKRVTKKKTPALERSRSSSLLGSCRFQNFTMPCNDVSKFPGNVPTDVIQGSLQRNNQIKKSPDTECNDMDSSAFVLSDSIEDSGSEIVTADSDSISLNEGSAIESSCKPEYSESLVEGSEGYTELSKGLDFQIRAVLIKKKRKPSRKRITNEAADSIVKAEGEADLEVHNSIQTAQNACTTSIERCNKGEGDEHLPLVKRARVRMGKPSPLKEKNNGSSQLVEKHFNEFPVKQVNGQNSFCQVVAPNRLEMISPSRNSCNDCSDTDAFAGRRDLQKSSPPEGCTRILGNGSRLLKVKETQSFGCSTDGEAALPPSKRLHRALEAMSANAAEEGELCAEASTTRTVINCGSISTGHSFLIDVGSKETNGLGEGIIDSVDCKDFACFSSSSIIRGEADTCNLAIESSEGKKPSKDISRGDMDADGSKVHHTTCIVIKTDSPVHSTPDINGGETILLCNHESQEHLMLVKDENNSENVKSRDFGGKNRDKRLEDLENCRPIPALVSQAYEDAKTTPIDAMNMLQRSAEVTTWSFRSLNEDNIQANGLCELGKDAKCDKKHDACHVSVSDDRSCERQLLVVQSSPLTADGVESPARPSPPTTSLCDVSTAESANFTQNSGCSSPSGHLQQKKILCTSVGDDDKFETSMPHRPKSVGKWINSTEAHATLSSFEEMLGSLTRTKESIGRATRLAIDCAKFGVCSKVVEILARSLESESNLHKRVDLFFLVDSITQCSRGLKGDVAGIYPSAIQAALRRLLSAAAPPGSYALENRRQCMKVLRLWLERRILPESVIRHHMRELDSLGGSSAGPYARRSARTERSLDDPVRDMEGMLVDEYGSNSSFQLPGFCMPRMLKDEDEGSDSDGESFEAVTPEHQCEALEEHESITAMEKHTHILEDVDGELEMEDVAPSSEIEMHSSGGIVRENAGQNTQAQKLHCFPVSYAPPLPHDLPPSSPPLPSSPPPPLPLPPPPLVICPSYGMQEDLRQPAVQQSIVTRTTSSISNGVDAHAPECREQMRKQTSCTTHPVRPMRDVQHPDGPSFYHKHYPLRPPHHPSSNQFSYVEQSGNYMRSRRGSPPPSYSHRYYSPHNAEVGHYYNNHERMRPTPYEMSENWRCPPFHGPRYPEKSKASYGSGPYGCPPRETNRYSCHEWEFPPRGTHHRNFTSFRPPPCEGGVPVAHRAPGIWRPR
ncbi:hypothetical protein K2173_004695 [Erythroxylum novogranatense]|uniref:Uncharacterized protein n=1 Tax=Erythroxylum novogranatense TaxID=1862640 RepID=A0AAV8UCY1_9ROSI|nr:hypothetical protein K2173_004695 [Erythroxylum novogranatense]